MTLLKNTLFIFALLFLSNCSVNQENYTIPKDAYIISKYSTFDEIGFKLCADDSPNFEDFNYEKDCAFILDEKEYGLSRQFRANNKGEFIEYVHYLPEGSLFHSLKDLEADTTYYNLLGLKNFNLSFSEDKKYIIDSSDTLEIECVFPNEKLIFTKKTSKQIENKRRVIYQYE